MAPIGDERQPAYEADEAANQAGETGELIVEIVICAIRRTLARGRAR